MISNLNRYIITSRRAICVGLLITALGAVSAQAQSTQTQTKVRVVASFSILADFVSQVAGDRAEVTSLVPANADAHVYSPKPEDAKVLGNAQLVVMNGLGFEGFMPRLIKSSGTKAMVVMATTGLKPLAAEGDGHGHNHDHGKADPHAWQSVEAVKTYIANIRDGLTKVDPAGEAIYKVNAARYLGELATLQQEIKAAIAALPPGNRTIITSHDAFHYYESEFGVTMESVQGVSTESAPSAKDMARIIRLTKEKKARAVFIENMTDPRMADRLAKETGAKLGGTLFSDALSDEKGPAGTYMKMMRHNLSELVAALR
jgi:zinc/manganese transport system substrate-binding protein